MWRRALVALAGRCGCCRWLPITVRSMCRLPFCYDAPSLAGKALPDQGADAGRDHCPASKAGSRYAMPRGAGVDRGEEPVDGELWW